MEGVEGRRGTGWVGMDNKGCWMGHSGLGGMYRYGDGHFTPGNFFAATWYRTVLRPS